jgi:hypothetical protein
MDPLDHVRADLDGLTCAVCDGPVPAGSVQLLAHRDALAFVQVDCAVCRSTTLAFVVDGEPGSDASVALPSAEPLTGDDVLDMHLFLRGWQGDLSSLLVVDAPGPETR